MEAISTEQLNRHKAQMFDAIREFFVALTKLASIGSAAVEAQLEAEKRRTTR